jgi:hypothetical protein
VRAVTSIAGVSLHSPAVHEKRKLAGEPGLECGLLSEPSYGGKRITFDGEVAAWLKVLDCRDVESSIRAPLDVKVKPVTRDAWLLVHRDLHRALLVRAVMAFLAACFT